jgi:leader peptidase (prepilin peptidase)/N-methyltransferase
MLDLSGFGAWLQSDIRIWPLLAALIGLQIGSFINLLVWRLPQMMQRDWAQQCAELQGDAVSDKPVFNLATPGSHCTTCHTPLRFIDLVPVLSFVFLKGRCAHCDAKVSWRYPLVEFSVAVLWAFCAWHWGVTWAAFAWAVFATVNLALALIDADTMLLPDSLTLPLLWGGMLCASLGWINLTLEQSVWGAALGYAVLWLVQEVFGWFTGKQGMGAGDFKLLAALGAWLGWMALPMLVLIASVSGVIIALIARLLKRAQPGEALPFGPHLVLAAGLLAVAGPVSLMNAWVL